MPRYERQFGEHIRDASLRRVEVQLHRRIIDNVRRIERAQVCGARRTDRRITRRLKGEAHVGGGGRHGVVPCQTIEQPHGQDAARGVPRPLAREIRLRLQERIELYQGHEQGVTLDLATERVNCDEWIPRLKIGARGHHNRFGVARRRAARRQRKGSGRSCGDKRPRDRAHDRSQSAARPDAPRIGALELRRMG